VRERETMKRFKSIIVAAFVVLGAAVSVLPSAPVSAESASLSIVPKKSYTIEPGKSVKDTLTIRNLDANETLELNLRIIDFTYTDDGGTPKLFLAEDAPQTTWSLKPYLSIPKSVSIPPRGSKTVDISVGMPANHGAGSFYSAILYSSGAPEGGNVGLSASGVTLVFTSIPGDVDEKLTLDQLGAYTVPSADNKGGYSWINTNMPRTIGYTLKNEGNVTESPAGSITLKHMFGEEQVIEDINPNKSLALIGQTRTFTSCIKLESEKVDFEGSSSQTKACTEPSLLPGLYTAKLNLFYGQNGNNTEELSGTATFWYLPWWFIIVSVIVLLIAAYFIWRIVRRIRIMTGKSRSRSAPRKQPRQQTTRRR